MFSGETAVELTTPLTGEAFHARVEEALAGLGRARVDRRGGLAVDLNPSLRSMFLTDVQLDGSVHQSADGRAEVVVRHTAQPTVACWLIAVVLFLTTVGGAAILLVPLLEKKQVARRVREALGRLEDVADDRLG